MGSPFNVATRRLLHSFQQIAKVKLDTDKHREKNIKL